jgi:5-methylcytosine-specific restriction protein A
MRATKPPNKPAIKVNRLRGRHLDDARARIKALRPYCPHCRAEGRIDLGKELDHITPLFRGGSNADSNLQLLCVHHHRLKTARERGALQRGCDADGVPLSPDSHWHK